MTRYTHAPTPPAQETVAPKTEELDWGQIDMTCPYALEFRGQARFRPRAHVRTAGLLLAVSTCAAPVAWALGLFTGTHLFRWEFAIAATLLGLILASANQLARIERPDTSKPSFDATTLFCLTCPIFGWLVVALAGRLLDLAGSFLYLAVALPAVIVAADRIATHAIHWMTANLLVDYATQLDWRKDWQWRFLRAPRLFLSEEEAEIPELRAVFGAVLQARTNYAIGFLWVFAGLVLPAVYILIVSRPANPVTIGLQLVTGIVFGMSSAALLRSGGRVTILARFWYMFTHYLHHAKGGKRPPWMFQSPCGTYQRRRVFVLVALALLSVSLTSLALHSTVRLAGLHPVEMVRSSAVPYDTTDSTPKAEVLPELTIAQGLVVLAIFSATVPPVVFLLILTILIGPAINAYHQALEE